MNAGQTTVSIIGNGRFGQYLERLINNLNLNYVVFIGEDEEFFPDKSDIIILAVPISKLESVVAQYRDFFDKDTTLIDVCSIKEYSQKVLRDANLPCTVINTHPMFGPQSAPDDCVGQRLVVCSPTNALFDTLFFDELGLSRIDASAEDHDREVAYSQVLNHLIGRAAKDMNVRRTRFATVTHDKFMDIVDIVNGNSESLFRDMFRYNRFASMAAESYIERLIKLHDLVSCEDDWYDEE